MSWAVRRALLKGGGVPFAGKSGVVGMVGSIKGVALASGSGTAVEGSVNKDLSGIKMFRCEFDAGGAFQRIFEPKPGE